MYRRRLLMQYAQYPTDCFSRYKTYDKNTNGLNFRWLMFEKSNQFQLERALNLVKNQQIEISLANFQKSSDNLNPSSKLLPMGYDSNKKYNFIIKVLNKNIPEGYNVEEFNGNGNFTFLFKGPEITKSSQSISIRDLDQGTEFIIPIEIGEIFNNFCVKYLPGTVDGEGEDYCLCRILFEVYFEEITE